LRDLDMNGAPIVVQPISEFPQFSFVLSDMHPHVLALPFAMLCIGLALNLVLRRRGLVSWEVFLYGLIAGGMIFLNSWDAIYLVFIVGAEAVRRLIANGTGKLTGSDWLGLARFGIALLGLTALLYLPFFASFRSQAEGIAPNVLWPTRFPQFFIMFGIFLVMIATFLVAEVWRAGATFNWRFALTTVGTIVVGFISLIILATLMLLILSRFSPSVEETLMQLSNQWIGSAGLGGVLLRRLSGLVTEGLLIVIIMLVIGRLFAREPLAADGTPDNTQQVITYSPSTAFVLLLIAAGAVLTLVPDFAYLRDNFGVRINTVFKLYYQGWLLWGIASAFALWSVLFDLHLLRLPLPIRTAFASIASILILLGLLYPIMAVYSRAYQEGGHGGTTDRLTLEATSTLAVGPDDFKAIQCLGNIATSDSDVVVEGASPASAYHNEWGRVSGLTGIPTILGWPNHEQQWRGNSYDQAANGRMEAVAKLYNTTNWADVIEVIRQYNVTYIYVGPTERQNYGAEGIAKFDPLPTVCREGDVAVYSADSVGLQIPPAGE
jgi:YYY domain-containing protein